MLLKSTTRHIRIFAATIEDNAFIDSSDKLTVDVDPDNEFIWDDPAVKQVHDKFEELVAGYAGQDLTEYNLRRIGSDLEHFVRSLLEAGEIRYNLKARAVNYSMGLPKTGMELNTGK